LDYEWVIAATELDAAGMEKEKKKKKK
jgi:hypothetical protein